MGRRNKCKPRLIPQQDKRICGSICFCQLMVVISCVSLIYLTVAIYIPAYRTFKSGFELTPVMCQTINTSMLNNCSWASCGEWCLTKTSGFCPQIHVTTRQNGTNLQFHSCANLSSVSCPEVDPSVLKVFNCNNGSECSTLTGFFNCSKGHCSNMSSEYLCHYKADGVTIDSDKDNIKLNGFFECKDSRCTKVKRAFSCDRFCDQINTTWVNVYIYIGETLHLANCKEAAATTAANGKEDGYAVDMTTVWTQSSDDEVVMVSCNSLVNEEDTLNLTDCINGTIFNYTDIPKPDINFTTFWGLSNKYIRYIDVSQRFLPMQSNITIYNTSYLYINLDGCVNTLKGECKDFLHTHGRDGRNQTAASRFPCFYKKNDSSMVLARHDLDKTWHDLVIALSVPSVVFIVSFISLCTIMQTVKVGDDTKMRCKYCMGKSDFDQSEIMISNSKYEVSSPDEPLRKDETPLIRP
ncbi:hypothetical protein FQR65_LT08302 [Abscondita terminalis]|nr:hypothetical protein FQR65_LT08302 [Abscondita terminalis]